MSDARAPFRLPKEWRKQRLRRAIAFTAAFVVLIMAVSASLGLGVVHIGPLQSIRALVSFIPSSPWTSDLTAAQREILQNLRLPRTLMAIVAGGGLSVAGAAMQGITRNVLVSPFTLGISPAAAFGASVAILLGLSSSTLLGPYVMVAAAFLSALVCASIVLLLSSIRNMSSTMLILCGVALNYLFGSLTATAQFVASEQQLAAIIHWTFGSLNGATWLEVAISGSIFVLSLPVVFANAAALNAFSAGGDDVAMSLGFAANRVRLGVTLATVLLTATIVSFVGVIGFVGLVAPHIARLLVGGDHRILLPFSALTGAVLLLAADLIGRLAFSPVIIPVGIVVAYIGVPIFLQLLLSQRRGWSD